MVTRWNFGYGIGMELALPLPQRVTGLILVVTSARPWGNHPPISWQDNVYTYVAALLNYIKPSWSWNIETFRK